MHAHGFKKPIAKTRGAARGFEYRSIVWHNVAVEVDEVAHILRSQETEVRSQESLDIRQKTCCNKNALTAK